MLINVYRRFTFWLSLFIITVCVLWIITKEKSVKIKSSAFKFLLPADTEVNSNLCKKKQKKLYLNDAEHPKVKKMVNSLF